MHVTHPQVYADETSLRPEIVPTMEEAKKFLPKPRRTSEDSEASSLKPLPDGPNRELMSLAGNSAVARRRAFRKRDVEEIVYDERRTKRSESSSTSFSDIFFADPPGSDAAPSIHNIDEASQRPVATDASMFYMRAHEQHDETRRACCSPSTHSTGQSTTASLPRHKLTFKRGIIVAWKSSTAVIRYSLRTGEWKQARSSPRTVLVKASGKRQRAVRP